MHVAKEPFRTDRSITVPRRPPGQPPTVGLLDLQRLAGNRAVAGLVSRGPSARPVVQRSGCGCKGSACAAKGREDVESVQRVNYSAEHMCGVSETARILSSWAVAIAKLTENIPFLAAGLATGLHTPQLKRKLTKHFSATTKAERQQVLGQVVPGYGNILLRMGPAIVKVKCGGTHCAHNWYAYTFAGTGNSSLWFCGVQFMSKPILDLASTWIHELSHAFYSTGDTGYYSYPNQNPHPNPAAALGNADSWGNFMVDYT